MIHVVMEVIPTRIQVVFNSHLPSYFLSYSDGISISIGIHVRTDTP